MGIGYGGPGPGGPGPGGPGPGGPYGHGGYGGPGMGPPGAWGSGIWGGHRGPADPSSPYFGPGYAKAPNRGRGMMGPARAMGPRVYAGNPLAFHHSFHVPSFYGFMHRPGFYYAGPMHHHGGGWSFFGPFFRYRGLAGPEFYFGRPGDPFYGPHGGPFVGAYYRGWLRGYGWHYPSTWFGGWFGYYPMGAPMNQTAEGETKNYTTEESSQSAERRAWLAGCLGADEEFEEVNKPSSPSTPKSRGIINRLADWYDDL